MTGLILRELRLALAGGAAALPLIFFLLVATLFPFAIGPDGPLLARAGGGALWIRPRPRIEHEARETSVGQ